jgi:hypothetical protein
MRISSHRPLLEWPGSTALSKTDFLSQLLIQIDRRQNQDPCTDDDDRCQDLRPVGSGTVEERALQHIFRPIRLSQSFRAIGQNRTTLALPKASIEAASVGLVWANPACSALVRTYAGSAKLAESSRQSGCLLIADLILVSPWHLLQQGGPCRGR